MNVETGWAAKSFTPFVFMIDRFSEKTLSFILRASRQTNPDWLDRNREEYEQVLLRPLQKLAQQSKVELSKIAKGYHFPVKGIGRLKRPGAKGREMYKDWLSWSAKRPSESRFENHPSLVLIFQPTDTEGDRVILAGGLYMPSSRQLKQIRASIASNPKPYEKLFSDPAFKKRFPEGFSLERQSSRVPRGFEPSLPRMEWIRLQGFYVWRSYSLKELASPRWCETMVQDFRQALRLNELLDSAMKAAPIATSAPRMEEVRAPVRTFDF